MTIHPERWRNAADALLVCYGDVRAIAPLLTADDRLRRLHPEYFDAAPVIQKREGDSDMTNDLEPKLPEGVTYWGAGHYEFRKIVHGVTYHCISDYWTADELEQIAKCKRHHARQQRISEAERDNAAFSAAYKTVIDELRQLDECTPPIDPMRRLPSLIAAGCDAAIRAALAANVDQHPPSGEGEK
jgi:hypothetical protein